MSPPRACPECLRRAHLLAALAPYIERASAADSGRRALELLRLPDEQLAAAVTPAARNRLLAESAAKGEDAGAESECWSVCRHSGCYPAGLLALEAPPAALFGRGDPRHLKQLALFDQTVALVGARRATSYGREVARTLGRELSENGLLVVSGMAFGVDACAHRGALEAGLTVAVLGCGADVAYPATHRSLWRRIQEKGLVLSELPPGTGAWRWGFPVRNRIIAALAGITVVVEATEGSGSLQTAELAAQCGRLTGAVPGPVGSRASAGANALLAGGAHVVRDARDVLEALPAPPRSAPERDPYLLRLDAEAVIGEDRVPVDVLRDLISTYGRGTDG